MTTWHAAQSCLNTASPEMAAFKSLILEQRPTPANIANEIDVSAESYTIAALKPPQLSSLSPDIVANIADWVGVSTKSWMITACIEDYGSRDCFFAHATADGASADVRRICWKTLHADRKETEGWTQAVHQETSNREVCSVNNNAFCVGLCEVFKRLRKKIRAPENQNSLLTSFFESDDLDEHNPVWSFRIEITNNQITFTVDLSERQVCYKRQWPPNHAIDNDKTSNKNQGVGSGDCLDTASDIDQYIAGKVYSGRFGWLQGGGGFDGWGRQYIGVGIAFCTNPIAATLYRQSMESHNTRRRRSIHRRSMEFTNNRHLLTTQSRKPSRWLGSSNRRVVVANRQEPRADGARSRSRGIRTDVLFPEAN